MRLSETFAASRLQLSEIPLAAVTLSKTFALSTFVVSSPDRSDVMSLSETFALSTFIVRSPDHSDVIGDVRAFNFHSEIALITSLETFDHAFNFHSEIPLTK